MDVSAACAEIMLCAFASVRGSKNESRQFATGAVWHLLAGHGDAPLVEAGVLQRNFFPDIAWASPWLAVCAEVDVISVHSSCLACGCSWALGAWLVPLSYRLPIAPSIRDVFFSLRFSRRSV